MKVFYLDYHDITDNDINNVKKNLNSRYEKIKKCKNEKKFKQAIGSNILIMHAFPHVKDDDFYYNESGKPYLKNNDYFNISHSGNYIILAKDKYEIGIDIEEIKGSKNNLARRIFNDDEYLYSKDNDYFYLLWTIKESIIKLLGKSISFSIKDINAYEVINDGYTYYDNKKIYCLSRKLDNYYISVASKKEIDRIELINIQGDRNEK